MRFFFSKVRKEMEKVRMQEKKERKRERWNMSALISNDKKKTPEVSDEFDVFDSLVPF